MKNKFLIFVSLSIIPFLFSCEKEKTSSTFFSEESSSSLSNASSISSTSDVSSEITASETSVEPSSESMTSEETSSQSIESSSAQEIRQIEFTFSDFPAPTGSGYPSDEVEIEKDNIHFCSFNMMQGGGEHNGTIQTKRGDEGEGGYLYNADSLEIKRIVVVEKIFSSAYFTNTALMSCFAGDEANQGERKLDRTFEEDENTYTVTFDFDEDDRYFVLCNLDGNAVYALSITIYY